MNNIVTFNLSVILFTMLISLCFALPKYTGLSLVLKRAALYLFFVFVEQAFIASIWWYNNQNSFVLFHIGNLGEAITVLLMYREMFKKHVEAKEVYVYRKVFIALIAFFIVLAVVNALCWQPINTYPSYTRTPLMVIIMIFSALHFYKYTYEPIPKEPSELSDYVQSRVPLFWINMGLLFFSNATLFISIFGGALFNDKDRALKAANISIVHALICVVLYIFIAIAFIKAKKRKR